MPAASKRTTDYLLVDISNSYTKIAFATTERLAKPMRLPTADLTIGAMRRILRDRNVRAVIVSSVVPAKRKVITAATSSARTLF